MNKKQNTGSNTVKTTQISKSAKRKGEPLMYQEMVIVTNPDGSTRTRHRPLEVQPQRKTHRMSGKFKNKTK